MPLRLPFETLSVPARQSRARVTEATLARHGSALLLLPVGCAAPLLRELPHGERLHRLISERLKKPGDSLEARVGARAETALLIVAVAPQASTFQHLKAAGSWARRLLAGEPESLLVFAHGLDIEVRDAALLAVVAAVQAAAFRLPDFKSKPAPRRPLGRIDIAAEGRLAQLDTALASSAGNNLARWLTALPPNLLDARGYRRLVQSLATRLGLSYRFYGEAQLKRLGAGAFLAVSQGNATRDAGIAHLKYRPKGGSGAPLALVGKGICFDTGGTNLKPHKSMLDMHTDMAGSAVVLGTLYALSLSASRQPVDAWLAITENRIGPTAYQPQDVVYAMNGTSIQVIHTDAEGRMVLADTLCLAAAAKPKAMIDYATLTGAAVYALTERYSAAFTNRPAARASIEAAGVASGERVWCFPMDEDFDSDIDSTVADVMQCAADGKGDHILAARFLNRFVPQSIPWLHLDLAAGMRGGGLAHVGTDITGFGVRYTLALLQGGWP